MENAGLAQGGSGSRGAWAQGDLSPSPSPPQLLAPSRGCPAWAQLHLTGTPSHRAVWSSPPPAPPGSPSPHLSRPAAGAETAPLNTTMAAWQLRRGKGQLPACPANQHGGLAAPCPRTTAPGMPWGAPSCCLTLRGHRPPARPRPPAGPMAASPGLP